MSQYFQSFITLHHKVISANRNIFIATPETSGYPYFFVKDALSEKGDFQHEKLFALQIFGL